MGLLSQQFDSGNVVLTTVEGALNWARLCSLWQMHFGLAFEPARPEEARNAAGYDAPLGNYEPFLQVYRRRHRSRELITLSIHFRTQIIIELQADSCAFWKSDFASGLGCGNRRKRQNRK